MYAFWLSSSWLRTRRLKPRGKSVSIRNYLGPKHAQQAVPRRALAIELLEERRLLDTGLGQIAGLTDTAPERFVTGLYYDLLYRVPQPAEVAAWVNSLNTGAVPTAIALGFTGSAEYQANLVLDDYNTYLGRDASSSEIGGWVNAMQGGMSAQAVSAFFLASGEYYQNHGGTNSGWLNGLYQDTLGRAPDAFGLSAWTQVLTTGTSRMAVASAIVNSQEADTGLIESVYQQLLQRNADPSGLNTWVALLQQGMTPGQLAANIAGSPEYYNGQTTNLAATAALSSSQNSWHFDFGSKSSPVAPGYIGVPLVSYLATRGYGWSSVIGLGYRNRNFANPLTRDFNGGSDGTFLVNLANGTYTVTATVGDAGARHTNMAIWANGTQEATGVTTVAGQFLALTFSVPIANGQLSLRIASTGGTNPTFALDGLDINPDVPLTVNAGPSQTTNEGSTVTFAGSESGGTAPFTYSWVFGDGTTSTGSLTPNHTYGATGTYTATLTVTDTYGLSSNASTTITVNNVSPSNVSLALGASSINEGSSATLSGSFSDPATLDTHQVAINWGDGSTNSTVSLGAGVLTFSGVSHQYLDNPTGQPNGSYTISVTVTDEDGASGSASTSIQVNGVSPTANPGGPYTGTVGSAIAFSGSATDPSPLDTAFTYSWNFGDGSTGSGASPSHTYTAAGTYTVTVTASDDDGSGTATTSAVVAQSGQSASSFQVSGFPSPTTAGTAGNFTVTALDASGHVVTGYTGTVQFTSTDAQAILPANYTFTTADLGVHTFTATLKTAGTQSVTATDTAASSVTGSQAGITVNPASASTLTVTAPGSATAGVAFNVTVTAKDAYGNTASGYIGTVRFTSTDSLATLPANYTFVAADGGSHTFTSGVTLQTTGSQTVTATDTATSSITGSAVVTVSAAGTATHFSISAPASVSAGTAFNFTVTALDASGNTVTGYTGTVDFASSSPSATLPNAYTFTSGDQGAHTFSAILNITGTQSLTAIDSATGITGTQSGINVTQTAGNTYYVSTTGSDSNPGTITQPFLTINHGVSVLHAGDTLYIRAGTYSEALLDDIPSGTSWNAPVTISAYASESVVLHPTSGSYVLTFRGSFSYIVVNGLTIDASSVTDSAVYIVYETSGDPGHIRLENSEVKNAPNQGIIVEAGTAAGTTPDYNEFVNLKVHDNGNSSLSHGFYIQSSHNLIQGCDIYNNSGEGIQVYRTNGVNGINCSYNVIYDNKVHNNGRAGGTEVGIGLYFGDGNLAYNNLIWQDFIGIAVEYGASNTLIYNNTIYDNTGDAGILIGYNLGATNTTIRNNIFYMNNTDILDFGTNTVADHNLLSSTNPMFVNAAAFDFHLQTGSPAINAGMMLSQVAVDFDGITRPQGGAYDIGAYEYH